MPALNIFDIGDNVDLAYSLTNASGVAANASVSAYTLDPAGASAGLTLTNPTTGLYETSRTLNQAGRWFARWVATGAVIDSETVEMIVRPSEPVRADDAYANIDDVVRLTQGRTYTASSKPTVTDVQDWLTLNAREIDGLLRRQGYSVPVATTATGALALLAHGNALGAAKLVEAAAPTGGRYKEVCALYESFREMVLAGDLELDAGKDSTNSAPRFNVNATAMFMRDMEF